MHVYYVCSTDQQSGSNKLQNEPSLVTCDAVMLTLTSNTIPGRVQT